MRVIVVLLQRLTTRSRLDHRGQPFERQATKAIFKTLLQRLELGPARSLAQYMIPCMLVLALAVMRMQLPARQPFASPKECGTFLL